MKVSVIIPVYNVEQYLQKCLDSIFNNTYRDLEVICINDGSTDSSLDILQRQNDSRLLVINQENQGVSCARNKGLEIATGDYISFIDPDDWIKSNYFEVAMKYIKDNDIVSFELERVIDDSKINYFCDDNEFDTKTLTLNDKHEVIGLVIKKEILNGLTFLKDAQMGEDTLFNAQLFNRTSKLKLIHAKLYVYVNREKSLTKLEYKNTLPIINEFYKLYKQDQSSLFLELLYNWILSYRYLNMFSVNLDKDKIHIKNILNECNKYLFVELKFSKAAMYYIMAKFPVFYRLFRIITDPTMLQWEKEEQRKLKKSLR